MRQLIPFIGVVVATSLLGGCALVGARLTPPDAGHTGPPVVSASADPSVPARSLILALSNGSGSPVTPAQADAAVEVIQARLASMGIPGATVTAIGPDRLRVAIPAAATVARVEHVATAPGRFLFVPVPPASSDSVVDGEPLPSEIPVEEVLDSDSIEAATAGVDEQGDPVIEISFDQAGADAFDAFAADHQGDRIAIVVDGIVFAAPTINARRYDGHVQIGGTLDVDSAQDLAAILAGGELPVAVALIAG